MRLQPLDGKVFGRLTVLRRAETVSKKTRWLCRCQCGTTITVEANNLKTGHTQSCGCLFSENLTARNSVHGKRHTPEYGIWRTMISRCTNPKCESFKYYGARGIKVCNGWLLNFEQFLADMGPRTSPAHSIDRINNDGDYEPQNCKWATRREQALNRRPRRTV